MLTQIKRFFEQRIDQPGAGQGQAHDLHLATAALLIEISRADTEIDPHERRTIVEAVQRVFGLEAAQTEELVALAEQEVEQASSLFQFTQLVDREFSAQEKKSVVEMLWQVGFADGHLDKHEEHLVRRIADLLHVSHTDFIHAKLRAAGQHD